MRGASDVLACQRQLAAVLEQMLSLARDGQLRQLPALDAQCAALAARLGSMEPADPPGADRQAIVALLDRIGASQAELNALVRPQFMALMDRIGAQRRPHDRMRGRKQPTHDPEKCPPGGARRSAGDQPH